MKPRNSNGSETGGGWDHALRVPDVKGQLGGDWLPEKNNMNWRRVEDLEQTAM
jgi:hypothetical protein